MDALACKEVLSKLNRAASNVGNNDSESTSANSTLLHCILVQLRTTFSKNEAARAKLIEFNIIPKLVCLLKKPPRCVVDDVVNKTNVTDKKWDVITSSKNHGQTNSGSSVRPVTGIDDSRGQSIAGSQGSSPEQFQEKDGTPFNEFTDLLLSVLGNLCMDQAARKQVIKYRGIALLRTILLETDKESIQRRCCRTLANLAVDFACRKAIQDTDITIRIVQLLEYTNDSECQLTYCRALILFAGSSQLNKTIISCNGIAILSRLSKFAPHMVKCTAVKAMADLGRTNCSVEYAQQVLIADGLGTLVEVSKQDGVLSQNALRVLIYVSRHNFIRPPLGSSGGIQTLKNKFDVEVSTVLKAEILNALCLFCNEAVNRVKLRQSDVLMIFIEALKDLFYSNLHNRIISALVNFLYDEVSFDVLLEKGLVPVLFLHLQRCAGFSFNLPKAEPFIKSLIESLMNYPTKKRKTCSGKEETLAASSTEKTTKMARKTVNQSEDQDLDVTSCDKTVDVSDMSSSSKELLDSLLHDKDTSDIEDDNGDSTPNSSSDNKVSTVSKTIETQEQTTDAELVDQTSTMALKETPQNNNIVTSSSPRQPTVISASSKNRLDTTKLLGDSNYEVSSDRTSHSSVGYKRPLFVDAASIEDVDVCPALGSNLKVTESSRPKLFKSDPSLISQEKICGNQSLRESSLSGSSCAKVDKDKHLKSSEQQQQCSKGEECDQTTTTKQEQRYVFRIDSPTYQNEVTWSADHFTDGQTCKQDFGNDHDGSTSGFNTNESALSPFSNSSYYSPDWSPDYNSQGRNDFSSEDSSSEKLPENFPKEQLLMPVMKAPLDRDCTQDSQSNISNVATGIKRKKMTKKKSSAARKTPSTSGGGGGGGMSYTEQDLYKRRQHMMQSDTYLAQRTTENNILILLSRVSQKENPARFLATVESFLCLLRYIGKVPFAYPRSIRILSRVVRNPFCLESLITFMAPAMIFLELMTSWNQRSGGQSKMFWTPSRGTMLNFNSAFAVDSYIKDFDDLFKAGQLILNDFSQVAEIHFGNSLLAQHLTKRTPQQDSVVACLPFLCRCRNVQQKLLVKLRGFDLLLDIINNDPSGYLSQVVILGLNYLSRHLNLTTTLQNIDKQEAFPKQTRSEQSKANQDCCLKHMHRNVVFVTDNGKKIMANQEEVTSRSEVFTAMLLSDFVEAERREVCIGYTTPEALEFIVHYLHGCNLTCSTIQRLHWPMSKLTIMDILNIMALADRYMLDKLRRYLACVIRQVYLDHSTVDRFYNAAVLHSYHDLSDECIKYCLGNVLFGKKSVDCFLRILKGPNPDQFLKSVKEMLIKHIQ